MRSTPRSSALSLISKPHPRPQSKSQNGVLIATADTSNPRSCIMRTASWLSSPPDSSATTLLFSCGFSAMAPPGRVGIQTLHRVRHVPRHHPSPRQPGRETGRRKPPGANDRGSPACTRGQNTPSAGEYMRTAGLAPRPSCGVRAAPGLSRHLRFKEILQGKHVRAAKWYGMVLKKPFRFTPESWVQIPSLTGYNHYRLHELKDVVRAAVWCVVLKLVYPPAVHA